MQRQESCTNGSGVGANMTLDNVRFEEVRWTIIIDPIVDL